RVNQRAAVASSAQPRIIRNPRFVVPAGRSTMVTLAGREVVKPLWSFLFGRLSRRHLNHRRTSVVLDHAKSIFAQHFHQRSRQLLGAHALELARSADFCPLDVQSRDARLAQRRRHLRTALTIALSTSARYFKLLQQCVCGDLRAACCRPCGAVAKSRRVPLAFLTSITISLATAMTAGS